MTSCNVCDRLWRFVTETQIEQDQKINLGSFEAAKSIVCPDHSPLIEAFREQCDRTSLHREPSTDVGFLKRGLGRGYGVDLVESLQNLGCIWELNLAEKPSVDDHVGIARILDRDWIDTNVAKIWKQECTSKHEGRCNNPLKISTARPTWLIDIEDKCIVPGDNNKTYVALSYRSAGEVVPSWSLSELQKPGVLEHTGDGTDIPLKIQHAMSLTALMGERYLWADFLCFDYSDPATITDQLSSMTSIYTGALFTIIAADGSREDGINGLRGTSSPRVLEQKIFPFRGEKLAVRKSHIFSLENWHDYHKRAWTYQEFKMSPRKLLFMDGQVHWQCSCNVWHEEIALDGKVDTYIDPRPAVLASGFPDLPALNLVLSNYNERQLTYEDDALAAITGLLSVFSRTFSGGFLYGLPKMFFDHALAWTPQWAHTNMRRRKPIGKPSNIRFASSNLPSWSWVGWQGIFKGWGSDALRINDRYYWIQEVSPITEWYTSSGREDETRRKISSAWYQNRDQSKDDNAPLPDGWIRLPAPKAGSFRDEPMLYPDGCGKYVYRHPALPDDDCNTWYYPFPVAQIDASTQSAMPEQTRYLFCKTFKVSLWSHRLLDKYEGESNHILTLRKSPSDPKIGTLHLQTDEQLSRWPKPSSEAAESTEGQTVELVAISRRIVHAKTFNEQEQRYDHPITREEQVNVLWLEWTDGVAYRLACGHVDKAAWDSLALEKVDLVMG